MANEIFNDDTIYIIDSYGLIYRCYFAFISRPLTDSNGRNISALFGFFRNLRAMIEHYKPKTLIAALDSKGKTFRHEMYSDYKATRPKTPEDLHAQSGGARKKRPHTFGRQGLDAIGRRARPNP